MAFDRVVGIVRADFRADAILERRDDLAARGVVLGIGREDHQEIQRQPNRVALDLHVAFLKDVEQSDLDLAGEVGQLVDGKDAAISPRQQAVVHRQLVGEIEAGLRRLDRIDVADHVGDGHVGRRQLFDEARLARQPRNRQAVAFARHTRAAGAANGSSGSSWISQPGTTGDLLVEQIGEAAQNPALGLTAQPEQDEVVTREDRVDQLRDDGVLVADDAGKERVARLQFAERDCRGSPA